MHHISNGFGFLVVIALIVIFVMAVSKGGDAS
jgi:hypothetical protein